MTSRRQFLRSAALGAAAVGAVPALLRAQSADASTPDANASGGASAIPPPAGAPTGLIDLHSHWFSPKSVEILSARKGYPKFGTNEKGEVYLDRGPGANASLPVGRHFGLGKQWFDIDLRLRELDAHGVTRQLISWPTTLGIDAAITPEEAVALWGAYNDELSAVVSAHGNRLSGVAVLASGDIDWSARELERAHDQLGLIGAVLPNNGFATLEGARQFAPVFEIAQKYRSHIYLHTGYANPKIVGQPPLPAHNDSKSARAALDNAWNFAASTITLAYSGFLDAYPDVTVQIAQLGGAGAIALVAEQVEIAANSKGAGEVSQRFRQIYLDTGAAGRGPEGIALATRVFGPERIVFGTDFAPQPSVAPVIHNILKSPITDPDRQKIFGDNARALLRSKGVAV